MQISIDEIKSTKWSFEAADFINRLLMRKPEIRLGSKGISELKEHSWFEGFMWNELYYKTLISSFVPEMKDNYDKNYCEAIDNLGLATRERYNLYLSDPKYVNLFQNYTFYKYDPKKENENDNHSTNINNQSLFSSTVNNYSRNLKNRCQSAATFNNYTQRTQNKVCSNLDNQIDSSSQANKKELIYNSRNHKISFVNKCFYRSLSNSEFSKTISPSINMKQKTIDILYHNYRINNNPSTINKNSQCYKRSNKPMSYLNFKNMQSIDNTFLNMRGGYTSRNRENDTINKPSKGHTSANSMFSNRIRSIEKKKSPINNNYVEKYYTNKCLSNSKGKVIHKNNSNHSNQNNNVYNQLFNNLNFLSQNKLEEQNCKSKYEEVKKNIRKNGQNSQTILINKIFAKCKKTTISSHSTASTSNPNIIQKNY